MASDQQFELYAIEDITINHYTDIISFLGSFPAAFLKGWVAMKEAAKASKLEFDGKRPMLLPLPHGVSVYFDSLRGGNEDQDQIDKEVIELKLALSSILKGHKLSEGHTFLACHVKKVYVDGSVSGA